MSRSAGAVLVLVFAVLAAQPAAAEAQTLRAFSTARQFHGDTRLAVTIDYAAGALTVTPGAGRHLYRMQLAFDPGRFQPLSEFDASAAAVRLGAEPLSGAVLRVASPDARIQNAVIELSPRVDLSVRLSLGAVDGAVELGGLRITDLHMTSGPSRAALRFSRPNAIRCGTATIEAGAAELLVVGLGNSRCERIDVEGGIGKLTLDFGGEWRENADVSVRMTVGELVIRLPRDIGVQLSLDRFLAAFQPAGLERRGTTFVSPGYDAATRQLDIALTTAVGGVRIEWID
jgi:hypothetical protein